MTPLRLKTSLNTHTHSTPPVATWSWIHSCSHVSTAGCLLSGRAEAGGARPDGGREGVSGLHHPGPAGHPAGPRSRRHPGVQQTQRRGCRQAGRGEMHTAQGFMAPGRRYFFKTLLLRFFLKLTSRI